MSHRVFLLIVITASLAFAAGVKWSRPTAAPALPSHIYRESDARVGKGDWGSIRIYTEDGTATVGTPSVLTAELEYMPGKRLQPPHQHAEEEFQYVISGSGTWTLNGREIPIKPGDLMYARPGDVHGIDNTSDQPLRFFVFKWKTGRAMSEADSAN